MAQDITEDLNIDLSAATGDTGFTLDQVAYDVSINNLGFVLKSNSDSPYRRETAQYKKDQFDNSNEPGEQTLTGWWLRSQTSWHHGAGIRYYEPAVDDTNKYKFYDSRGIDIWTQGEIGLLKDSFHLYPASGTAAGQIVATAASSGGTQCMVIGDALGALRRVSYNGNSAGTVYNYTSLATGHNSGATDPFVSITTDGTYYYAMCQRAIHRGSVDGTTSADVVLKHSSAGFSLGNSILKYAKGYLFASLNNVIYNIDDPMHTGVNHNTGTDITGLTNKTTHMNNQWKWVSITGGLSHVFAAGKAGGLSEIWKIPFDSTGATLAIDMPQASVVAQLPYGETVNVIESYLSYLIIGTNKGVRVATVNVDGTITYGPLLYSSNHPVTGFVTNGTYVYASTTAPGTIEHAVIVRIDLGTPFEDGTFAYAYDFEYESDEVSEATGVFMIDDRLVIVTQEGDNGELIGQHTTNRRASGWLETGYIRYGTVEPKHFKYLQTTGLIAEGDGIGIETIDTSGAVYNLLSLDTNTLAEDVKLSRPVGKQEMIALRFTLTNGSPVTDYPTLQSYQVKAVPATPRQRLIQYPLSCFDTEMDKNNMVFGYNGRAYETFSRLEELEKSGDFVSVVDYRTGESFDAIIEEIRFVSESSADKNSPGVGGTILVTVRKY
jgi:hypothetical protein